MSSKPVVFFPNPYNLWDIVPAAILSLNHNDDRDSLSNQ